MNLQQYNYANTLVDLIEINFNCIKKNNFVTKNCYRKLINNINNQINPK